MTAKSWLSGMLAGLETVRTTVPPGRPTLATSTGPGAVAPVAPGFWPLRLTWTLPPDVPTGSSIGWPARVTL